MNLSNIRSKIVHSKMFINRAMGWISIANAGMLLFLTLSNLEKYGVDIRLTDWFIPIFIVTIILLGLFGFMEDKLGFFKEEIGVSARRNPFFTKIMERLDRIEASLQ